MDEQPVILQLNKKYKVLTRNFNFIYKNENITIPVGYKWDGATCGGKLTRFLVGLNRFGQIDRATLIHDYIYSFEGRLPNIPFKISRKETDKLFKNELKKINFKGLRLFLIYITVRIGGLFLWFE